VPIAFVFITTDTAYMVQVLKRIRAIEGVEEAQMVYGVYDIVAKVKGDTIEKLKHTITEQIRRIDKVYTAITMMVEEPERLD